MKNKIIITLACLLLMFASNYDTSINVEETITVQAAQTDLAPENANGNNTFILNENGEKVQLVENFNYDKSTQALMMFEQFKKIKYDYKTTYDINNDMRAWISIKDYVYSAVADTPEDFMKYFRANLYKEFDWAGIPFMSATSLSTFKGNTLIYGHNMTNGSAFGKIRHLADQENFKNAAPLIIYDGKEDVFKVYKAFTIFTVEDGVEFVNLKSFDSEEQRQNYNKYLFERSFMTFEDGWDIDWSKDTLFLQQCYENDYGDARRVLGFYEFAEVDGSTVNIDNYKP